MKHACRLAAVLGVAFLLVPGLFGCIQLEVGTVLFPDGSGKLVMSIGIEKAMLKMAGQGHENPMESFSDPRKLAQNNEGIVAWSEPKTTEDGEWMRMTVTGYFEDIRKVKLYNDKDEEEGEEGEEESRQVGLSFEYRPEGEGGTLTVRDDLFKDVQEKFSGGLPEGEDDEAAKAMAEKMMEMMKPLLKGFKMGITFTVPGEIAEASGVASKKDRTASITMDGDMMIALMNKSEDAKKKMEALGVAERKIVWKKNATTAAESEAFKRELADAKVKWKEILEKAEKDTEEDE
ncbi:MAG: hypothetical protein HYY16_18595 [Planctomycetes bacterium]|nr:hypothetical protein [Planctomycetota bacterium]